jgi:hypothetical protein
MRRLARWPLGSEAGLTLMELMVAAIVAAIVLLALVTMYITSMQAWDRSGARLALQRNAALALNQVVFDVRHGSRVEIGAGSTELTVYRTTAGGDSLSAYYQLVGDELRNQHGTVLVDKITSLQFTSPNGTHVDIQMNLVDDLGTSALEGDDKAIYFRSAAVCRNAV